MSHLTRLPSGVRRGTGRAPSDPQGSGVSSPACSSPPPGSFPRRPLRQLLEEPGMSVARPPRRPQDDVDTLLLTPSGAARARLAAKVATTRSAEAEVEREARQLVEVRRLELGRLRATVPRFVQLCEHDGRLTLVESALPGRALAGAFCGPVAVSHRRCRPAEVRVAGAWLAEFQEATLRGPGPVDLLTPDVIERLDRLEQGARGDHPLSTVAERARSAQELLLRHQAPRSAVHGDFRPAHLLVDVPTAGVSGVLGWKRATPRGEPLVDLGRFAVTQMGHRSTARAVPGAVVLDGRGSHAEETRRFVRDGLSRLGLPEGLWYAVAWAATATLLAESHGYLEPRRAAAIARLLARTPDPAHPV